MSAAFPIAWFITIGAIWLSTSLAARKLRLTFLERAGDDPSVPHELREPGRDPEKLFYFFRESSVPRLKSDPELWRLRERLRRLMILSFAAPTISFGVFFVVVLFLVRAQNGHL